MGSKIPALLKLSLSSGKQTLSKQQARAPWKTPTTYANYILIDNILQHKSLLQAIFFGNKIIHGSPEGSERGGFVCRVLPGSLVCSRARFSFENFRRYRGFPPSRPKLKDCQKTTGNLREVPFFGRVRA
jgi:hypothetical protein